MAAYPAGGSALGRILLETGDFCGASIRARERTGAAGHGCHHRVSGGYGPEVDHACADAEFDAGHAAARPALWSHRTGRKVQQLSIVGDEDELGLHGCQFHRTNHPVAGLEANHIPRVLAEYFRVDPFHHTPSCAKRQAERIIGQCGQAERLLSGVQGHQLTDVSAPLEIRSVGGYRHGREIQCADLDQPAGAGDQAALAACRGNDLGDDEVMIGTGGRRRERLRVVGPGK